MQSPPGQGHHDEPAIPSDAWLCEDRGSFTHGVCRSCSWVGHGRRSRKVAASDAELHALAGCEIPAPAATKTASAAPRRERDLVE